MRQQSLVTGLGLFVFLMTMTGAPAQAEITVQFVAPIAIPMLGIANRLPSAICAPWSVISKPSVSPVCGQARRL